MRKQFTHTWHIYVTKAIYALLALFCRENDLRASSGKFLRVKYCRPESFDFLCLWYTSVKIFSSATYLRRVESELFGADVPSLSSYSEGLAARAMTSEFQQHSPVL